MKFYFYTILLLFISMPCFADLGNTYFLKVKVKTTTGQIKEGYFRAATIELHLNITQSVCYTPKGEIPFITTDHQDQIWYSIAPSDRFSKYVLSSLRDTLTLHSNRAFFSCNQEGYAHTNFIKLFGKSTKEAVKQIESLQVLQISYTFPGVQIMSELTSSDTWINNQRLISSQQLGGEEICSYQAISFENLTTEAQKSINEFKDYLNLSQKQEKWDYNKRDRYIAKLKQYRIIVVRLCSC